MSEPFHHSSTPAPTSTMATVSLVAGILGLTILPGIASVIALITGYMAMREIRDSGGRIGGESTARIGIILGWVAVGLAVLAICCFSIFFFIPFFGVLLEQASLLPALVL